MAPRRQRSTKKKGLLQALPCETVDEELCSKVPEQTNMYCLSCETVDEELFNEVPEETNMYWSEIASLCVDAESLRIQKVLLRKQLNREKILRASEKPEDKSALKGLMTKTKVTFSLIAMLEGDPRMDPEP
jgi:hypothetical protein